MNFPLFPYSASFRDILWTCVLPAVLATSLRLTLQKEIIYSSWKSKNHMYELTYLFCCFLLTKFIFLTAYWLEPNLIDFPPFLCRIGKFVVSWSKPRWRTAPPLSRANFSHLVSGGMPPHPPRGSHLRRSYLITPLNKYSCQYEHLSKTLSYGSGLSLIELSLWLKAARSWNSMRRRCLFDNRIKRWVT